MSLSSAWPPCTITAVALISEAASQVSCRILRDGIRIRLFADATLMRYGAWTYSGTVDAFSCSASSRGFGFFQLCGLPRKNCTTSAPSAWAAARGSSLRTCEPISTSASVMKSPGQSRGFFISGLPVVAVAVVVQRHRSPGGLAEVRAVVVILVGRDRVRRGAGLLGGLHLDVAVAVDTGTGRNQLSDDHVLLETVELVAAAVDRRIGQDSRGLLERRRTQPRVGGQRRLRDTHQHRPAGRGLAALGHHPAVLRLELRTVDQRAGQELRRARVDDGDPAQHLANDHLDVLVVDRHTLSAVDLLDLTDQVDLHLAGALHAQHLVRVGRAFHQLLAHLDVVAIGQHPLGAVFVLEHPQALPLGQLVVHHFFATVVGNDGDLVEALTVLEPDPPGDVGDRRLATRDPGLEQLLHTRQTAGDVLTDTTLVEGTHGQLRAGLADGLGGHDTDGFADVDQLAGGHGPPVARRADARAGCARQHRAHLDLRDTRRQQGVDLRVAQVLAARDDDVAGLVDRVGSQSPRVRRCFDVRVADQRAIGLALGQLHDDAALGLAVVLADDHVLRHVHQTTGQIPGVGGTQSRVRQALSRTVGVDEVLQHRQALAERRLDRARDEFTLRVGHQTLHAGQRPGLGEVTRGTRVDDRDDGVVAGVVLPQRLTHLIGGFLPDLHQRLVALVVVQSATLELLFDLVGPLLVLVEDLLLPRWN